MWLGSTHTHNNSRAPRFYECYCCFGMLKNVHTIFPYSKCKRRVSFIRLVKNDNTDNRVKRKKKNNIAFMVSILKSRHINIPNSCSHENSVHTAHKQLCGAVPCSESIPRILFQTIDRLSLFHFLLFLPLTCMHRFVSSSAFLFSINTP